MALPPNLGDAPTAQLPQTTPADPGIPPIEPPTEPADTAAQPAKNVRPALAGKRLVLVLAIVAILAMVAGVVLSRFIESPAEAAAKASPPPPGLITVPIEQRTISNTVTTRGDVRYADAVEIKPEASTTGASIVTGQIPKVGDTFQPGSVALEVAGRPVIVLPGELPAYRSLKYGLTGPDVLQLKQALAAMGFDSGSLESDLYEEATATAVTQLYNSIGYDPPSNAVGADGKSADDPVKQAKTQLSNAQKALASAQKALAEAQKPDQVARTQADNAVREAERALATAQATGTPNEIAAAQDNLRLVALQRDQAYAPKDTSAEADAVSSAYDALTLAEQDLVTAEQNALTPLPSSEIYYLTNLPRRVDDVKVTRGSSVKDAAMTVSGATLTITATINKADSELLKVGDTATVAVPDGSTISATIESITQKQADANSKTTGTSFLVTMKPNELTDAQLTALKDQNVRVSIPVSATNGEVLAVPISAVQAGPGGESRIEVLTGERTKNNKTGQTDEETVLVTVQTGLAAEGYVEITPEDPETAKVGAKVVVGR